MDHTDEENFINSLYDDANQNLKKVYKEQKDNRDELLKEIAAIMLAYTIIDSLMSLTKLNKKKEYSKLSKMITESAKGQGTIENSVIKDILSDTVNETFDFYSYNAELKDVNKIIGNNFKGKHFSTRVWDNESDVAKHLHKQVNDFLKGKVNVNQIKKNIENTYNTNAYNAKRLVETEVNRCEDESFKRFCKETGVKKIMRNEVLDMATCSECEDLNGNIYDLDDAPGVVHPMCRGFNTIVE